MKTLRLESTKIADLHWNNQYTLFSESVTLLQKLISTPSFSGQENNAASLLANNLSQKGIQVNRMGNNVWAFNKYYDPAKPTILLNSHLDTVLPNEAYKRDPFCPEISNGILYGLGSSDAGGCLVSLVAAFQHFYHQQHLSFNLCLAITAEEENSGENGIQALLPTLGKIHFAIVGEPTLLQMAISEKGNLVIDCKAIGRPGHAAREEGDNAIYKSLSDIEWFRNYRFTSKNIGIAPVKMTITEIKAGLQHNIVPGICDFTVDIRNNETYTHQQILDVIRKSVSSEITVRPGALKASAISIDHPIVQVGISLGCKTYDSPTSSDRAWLNCPSVKLGPGDSARSHMPDEYIYLEDIKKGINLYIRLLERLPFQLINGSNGSTKEITPAHN